AFVEERPGALDLILLPGDITVHGTPSNPGVLGNLTATTDLGTITQSGGFWSIGDTTFTTGAYFDADTVPNQSNEPAALQASGQIVCYGGTVYETRGPSSYTAIATGTTSGKITYGGGHAANTLQAHSELGNIDLDICVQDFDRNGN